MKGRIREFWEKIRHNHLLMMVVCCIVPLGIVFLFVTFLGISRNYLVWTALIMCPLSHYFLMKGMHGGGKDNKETKDHGENNKEGKCH